MKYAAWVLTPVLVLVLVATSVAAPTPTNPHPGTWTLMNVSGQVVRGLVVIQPPPSTSSVAHPSCVGPIIQWVTPAVAKIDNFEDPSATYHMVFMYDASTNLWSWGLYKNGVKMEEGKMMPPPGP